MALPLPPDGPWTSPSSPRYSLHPIPLSVIQALEAGDLDHASSLLPASLPHIPPFLINEFHLGFWRRRLDLIAADPMNIPWLPRLVVYEPESNADIDVQEHQNINTNTASANQSIIVGRIGFHRKPDERGSVEVGYEIDPAHQRKGHAKAALKIIIDVARTTPGVNLFRASTNPENWISRKVVEGEGLKKVGTERVNGRLQDKFEMEVI